jgi:hypothetical protein
MDQSNLIYIGIAIILLLLIILIIHKLKSEKEHYSSSSCSYLTRCDKCTTNNCYWNANSSAPNPDTSGSCNSKMLNDNLPYHDMTSCNFLTQNNVNAGAGVGAGSISTNNQYNKYLQSLVDNQYIQNQNPQQFMNNQFIQNQNLNPTNIISNNTYLIVGVKQDPQHPNIQNLTNRLCIINNGVILDLSTGLPFVISIVNDTNKTIFDRQFNIITINNLIKFTDNQYQVDVQVNYSDIGSDKYYTTLMLQPLK